MTAPTSLRPGRRAAAAAVVLLLLASAGSTAPKSGGIAVQKKGMLITSERSIDGAAYELLGPVRTECRSISITETEHELAGRCSGNLAKPALELNASAVLGVHLLPTPVTETDQSSKFASGVSGIAVRTSAPGEAASRPRAAFVVAVLPLELPDSLVHNDKERRQLGTLMQEVAMAAAEERGYYAERAGDTGADPERLAAMSDSAWNAAFGPWAGSVLATRLVAAVASHSLMRSKHAVTVEVRLFSRDSTRVVWARTQASEYAAWDASVMPSTDPHPVVTDPLTPPGARELVPGPTKLARVETSLAKAIHGAIASAPRAQPGADRHD